MLKKIDYFFNNQISLILIFLTSSILIIMSNSIYEYEAILSQQDASGYILLAKKPYNYFLLSHQESMRIFPSLIVFFVSKIGISIENSFKYLTYLSFVLLNFKLFYSLKSFEIKNYLALSCVAILIYHNHSIIYSVFNYYQFLDIITYLLILYFVDALKNKKLSLLFVVSLCSIFTKEYLLILAILANIKFYHLYREKLAFISLMIIASIFLVHYNFAASLSLVKESSNLFEIILSIFKNFSFFHSLYDCLFLNKNIFLFTPFFILFFYKRFIIVLINNYELTFFSLIPIGFSLFIFNFVGNNFFRVFYHGYFILLFLIMIYMIQNILDDDYSKLLFFISPSLFLIDYFYIFFNIKNHGFFEFYQVTRYSYFSGFYLFSFLIFLILFMKLRKDYINKMN